MSDNVEEKAIRKMPIRSRKLVLDGDWAGWEFEARMNPPISIFSDIASMDWDRMMKGLSRILRTWNFVDEYGDPLPQPDKDSVGELPTELVSAVCNKFIDEVTKLPPS